MIAPHEMTLAVGETGNVTTVIDTTGGGAGAIVSSDTRVASLHDGAIEAVGVGTAIITVSKRGDDDVQYTDSCTITVVSSD